MTELASGWMLYSHPERKVIEMVYKHTEQLQKENTNVSKDIIQLTIMLHCEALIKTHNTDAKQYNGGY